MMFAPEGYLPFTEVIEAARRIAWNHVNPDGWEIISDTSKNSSDEAVMNGMIWRRSEEHLLTAWLMAKLMHQVGVYICSPAKTIFKCSDLLHIHEDLLDWFYWPEDVLDDEQTAGPFCVTLEESAQNKPLLRFRYIDVETGTIRVLGRELAIRDYIGAMPNEPVAQISIAAQFEGWAVCFKESDFAPIIHDTIADVLHQNLEANLASMDHQKTRLGRRRKTDQALLAYDKIFPTGHGSLTWQAVTNQVVENTGVDIHHQTLMRAVNQREADEGSDKSPE